MTMIVNNSADCNTNIETETKTNDVEIFHSPPLHVKKAETISTSVEVVKEHEGSNVKSSTNLQKNQSEVWLGLKQINALLKKHMICKIRTPTTTFIEFFSPVAMVLILMAAHQLSDIIYENEATYDTIEFTLPGSFSEALLYGTNPFSESDSNLKIPRKEVKNLLNGPVPIPTLNDYVALSDVLSGLVNLTDDDASILINESSFGRQWGNLLTLGTLHVTPSVPYFENGPTAFDFVDYLHSTYASDGFFVYAPDIVDRYDSNVNQTKQAGKRVLIRVHETADIGMNYINNHLEERAWALIDIGHERSSAHNAIYTIRMNSTTVPNTNIVSDWIAIGLNSGFSKYYLSGFLTLQRTLADFSFQEVREKSSHNFFGSSMNSSSTLDSSNSCMIPSPRDIWSMPMPTAAFSQNVFYAAVGFLLGTSIAMAFLYPVSRLVKSIVEEKESRMKQTLEILGVKPYAYWLSWVIASLLSFGIIAVFVTMVLSKSVLGQSDPKYIFAFIALYCTSIIAFSFFIAAFFSRAKLASILAPVALFATLLPRYIFFGTNTNELSKSKMLASILPCTAFSFGASIIGDFEYAETGIQHFNAGFGDYSFKTCLKMLSFDTFFFFFLSWYLDKVIPSQYGVAHPFYFPFQPSYWGFNKVVSRGHTDVNDRKNCRDSNGVYEPVDSDLDPKVCITNLVKRYSGKGKENAVNHLNLDLFEGEITCLLGHNGAGKTSTISVLTGLYPPTSGDCIIYGYPISTKLSQARQSMGICPQQNVLFQELTVAEHLHFFEQIKGLQPTEESIKCSATDVGLLDKLQTLSGALSGGMKRKLCVAIALSGNPKLVLLDEPTSGMDPYSRRKMWDLLRQKKNDRVILLTTHYMDEAEVLADRIVVMKSGGVQCYGTLLYLKKRFALGVYKLTLVMDEASKPGPDSNIISNGDITKNLSTSCKVNRIASFLQNVAPNTTLLRQSAKELVFKFPAGSEESFPFLFDRLEDEQKRQELGIGGYGVSIASLEDVFLHLADESSDIKNSDNKTDLESDVDVCEADDFQEESNDSELTKNFSGKEFVQEFHQIGNISQIAILLKKRATVQRRDRKGTFFTIILPVILIALVLLILKIDPKVSGEPLTLSIDLYGDNAAMNKGYTTIPVGSGVSQNSNSLVADDALTEMIKTLSRSYPKTDFQQPNVSSSQGMSQHLLDTYDSPDHATRFGSFVLNDIINFFVTVNFDEYDSSLIGSLAPEILGISGAETALNVTLFTDLTIFISTIVFEKDTGILIGDARVKFLDRDGKDVTVDVKNITISIQEINNIFSQIPESEIINFLEGLNMTNFADVIDYVSFAEEIINNTLISSTVNENTLELVNSSSINIEGSGTNTTAILEDIFEANVPNITLILNETVANFTNFNTTLLFSWISNVINLSAVTVHASSIVYYGNKGATINNLSLSYFDSGGNENTANVGNVTLSMQDFRDILEDFPLPQGNMSFQFDLNSSLSILHNSSSSHSVAVFNQAYTEFLYKKCTRDPNAKLSYVAYPLPLTSQQNIEVKVVLSMLASLFLLIPYCYVPAAFVTFLVKEKACKSKHVQLVSGVDMFAFWISTYIWDMFLYLILTALILAIFLLYGTNSAEVFVGDKQSFLCTLLLTFGYGTSAFPFAYLISRKFDNHNSAQISVMAVFFLTGFVAVNAHFIMSRIEATENIAQALLPLFRLWPPYHVGDGLLKLAINFWEREVAGGGKGAFDWEVTGEPISFLFGLSFPYFMLLLLFEYSEDGGSGGFIGRYLRWLRTKWEMFIVSCHGMTARLNNLEINNLDADVLHEKDIVSQNKNELKSTAALLLVNVWKIYPPSTGYLSVFLNFIRSSISTLIKCRRTIVTTGNIVAPKKAVCGLSTSIYHGETFGLLGVNGAGKTTTIGILTGDISLSSGEAYVAGHDISGRVPGGVVNARKCIGFCPQVDPLLDLMSGRETLSFFGRLRGIPDQKLNDYVSTLIDALTLSPHADKPAGTYSGGNKRKLSLGIALIGNPQVLFIDEASSGMDPLARRKMWDLISNVSKNRSVVLTTHSMEEAEALCSRLTIMVAGQMKCIGSVQHLKSTYLNGYTVDLQCSMGASKLDVNNVKKQKHVLETALPFATLAEQHNRLLRFSTPSMSSNPDCSLSNLFRELESMKHDSSLMAQDYAISQCTLEQVFISFARPDAGQVQIHRGIKA